MIKLKYCCQTNWLLELLKQHYLDIEISDDAGLIISDNEQGYNISLVGSNNNWIINKPISIANIINIIDQVTAILEKDVVKIGPVVFFPRQKICIYDNQEIALTPKEADIILYLINHPEGKCKHDLLESVWGYSAVIATNTIESHIYKLRNKFQDKYNIILFEGDKYKINR